jgi:hypothetical protein
MNIPTKSIVAHAYLAEGSEGSEDQTLETENFLIFRAGTRRRRLRNGRTEFRTKGTRKRRVKKPEEQNLERK